MLTISKTYTKEDILEAKEKLFKEFLEHVGALGNERELDIIEEVIFSFIELKKGIEGIDE